MMITRTQIQKYILSYHHLLPARKTSAANGVLDFIRKVGCIQFDPLNKAGRNADLVLQSRFKNYSEEILQDLLYNKRQLIDGWDKCMSIWPIEDWPSFSRYRKGAEGWLNERAHEFEPLRKQIFDIINKEGYICSSDIDQEHKVDWWWAPAKIGRAALESLYHAGELVIHHKKGIRKYYGSARDIVPERIYSMEDPNHSDDEFAEWYVRRRVAALGILWDKRSDAWIGCPVKTDARKAAFARLTDQGLMAKVTVQGFDEEFYLPASQLELLETASNKRIRKKTAAFLAPLDNVLWDRNLTRAIFNFDYKWEVYTPVKQRRYGYYVLPVLVGADFAGRVEPVLDKKSNRLQIMNWWPEAGFKMTPAVVEALEVCVNQFRLFLGADSVVINKEAAANGFPLSAADHLD